MKNLSLFLLLLVCTMSVVAQKIPFQGRLLDGEKPFNGTATIEFSIDVPSWTETKANVPVVNGYYSVVLGESTPLPDTLFADNREVPLSITINGQAIGPVTLYSPLLPYTGPQGIEVDTLRTFMAEAIGVNDEGKSRITTTNDGYDGVMSLTDSLGRTGNFMQTRKTGGYLQLAQQDFTDNSFKSAALLATFGEQNSYMDLFGGNSAGDGTALLVDVYASNIDLNGPIADGYRRGGIDLKNYYGSFTHNIFSFQEGSLSKSAIALTASETGNNAKQTVWIASGDSVKDAIVETRGQGISLANISVVQDPNGPDPTGSNGALSLWGDSSPNFILGKNQFGDHDQGEFNLYGSIPTDDGLWWYNTARIGTIVSGSGDEFAYLGFANNRPGASVETVRLLGNFSDSGAGALELNDSNGGNRVVLNGSNGNISANRVDGGSAINLFVNADNGGIAIQNASDRNKFFYEASAGTLELRDDAGINQLVLDGNLGILTAVTVNQTSDRRFKTDITQLEGSLDKTLTLRGVSYQWKDPSKSQERQIGLIAQEVEKVYPEFVHTDANGMKSVNYAQMTAVLIEAIKEMNLKVAALEEENSTLKASMEEVHVLRQEMDQLIKLLGSSKAASK